MKNILLFLIILSGATWLGLQFNEDPGYVMIAFHHWTVETTLGIAVLSIILGYLIIHYCLILLHELIKLPNYLKRWQYRRHLKGSRAATRQGLIEFNEGYWTEAKKHLLQALPYSDTPLINYLTAARAAQELGEFKLRDNYLREAQQAVPDAKIAVKLTQAQLQLANKQWEQALATLKYLHMNHSHHPYVLKLLVQLYQEVRDWPSLIELLPELKKRKIFANSEYEPLYRYVYTQAIDDLVKLNQKEPLKQLFKDLPNFLVFDPALMAIYSNFLIEQNDYLTAELLLRKCLQKNFSEQLVHLYGKFFIDKNQLNFAESLLKKQSNSAILYLCLARLSFNLNLWGKARSYVDQSLLLKPTAQAYELSGQLYDKTEAFEEAKLAYQQGLELANKTSNN